MMMIIIIIIIIVIIIMASYAPIYLKRVLTRVLNPLVLAIS